MPRHEIKARNGRKSKRYRYDLHEIAVWYVHRREKRRTDPDDPLVYAAANTPGLERLRKAKAEIAELELHERQRRVVQRDDVRELLALVASHYRRAGETLQRRFGRDAAQVVLDAVEQAEEAATKRLSAGNGGSD